MVSEVLIDKVCGSRECFEPKGMRLFLEDANVFFQRSHSIQEYMDMLFVAICHIDLTFVGKV